MRFSLPAHKRLRSKPEFDSVFESRNKFYGDHFLVYYRYNGCSHSRIGLIVAKRNVRLAVERNRVRRLLKEHFRQQPPALRSTDVVFIAKKGINTIENKELSQCIQILLKRIQQRSSNV